MPTTPGKTNLGMMVKYWEPGAVKTRLGKSIGMVRSAQLYRVWVRHLCHHLSSTCSDHALVFSPPSRRSEIEEELSGVIDSWSLVPQSDGDLGQRMWAWFESHFASPSDIHRAILIGGDCPLLARAHVEQANQSLASHDVVLGPAVDGGYYLIGLRLDAKKKHRLAGLFRDMPWSTDGVLQETVQRIDQAGLSVARLEVMQDIDTVDEWHQLLDCLNERVEQKDLVAIELLDQIGSLDHPTGSRKVD